VPVPTRLGRGGASGGRLDDGRLDEAGGRAAPEHRVEAGGGGTVG
jgi:hypothetical protein